MNEHEHEGCDDPECAGNHMTPEERRAWEAKCLIESGFWVDYVHDEFTHLPHPLSHLVNYHTHGFSQLWKHPDFQIVLPLSPEQVMPTFHSFADRVRKGERFHAGQVVSEIIREPYKVKLVAARECDRDVLRILVPDKKNRFPGDPGCDPAFAIQGDV